MKLRSAHLAERGHAVRQRGQHALHSQAQRNFRWYLVRAARSGGQDARAPGRKKKGRVCLNTRPRQHDQAGYPDFSPSGLKL